MAENLVTLTIHENITEIGNYSLYFCSKLKNVIISEKNQHYKMKHAQ